MLGRKIEIFFFLQICQAVWAISYSLLESQKSTKAAVLVALVVMTPLRINEIYRGSPTSTVSTSTNSTSTFFCAIGMKLVLVEFLELAM